MNNQINLKQPVATTLEDHPEIIDLLVKLGFSPLKNPLMRNTLAKAVSLEKGAELLNIPIETIIQELKWNGYELKGDKDDQ